MRGNDYSHVGHTVIGYFDDIFVVDFIQVVMGGKC